MRRWQVVALLVILAAGLVAGLVEYGERRMTTYADYHVVATRPDAPLITVFGEVFDTFCPSGRPDDPCAFATERGFFVRHVVPRLVGLLGGIVLPVLLVLTALGIAIRRRWARVALLLLATLSLSGMTLTIPVKYFHGTDAADVRQQIAAAGIYVANVDTGMSCLGRNPCIDKPYYAFARGVFAAEGIPKPLAIGLGLIVPGLLLLSSVAIAFRHKPRKTPS